MGYDIPPQALADEEPHHVDVTAGFTAGAAVGADTTPAGPPDGMAKYKFGFMILVDENGNPSISADLEAKVWVDRSPDGAEIFRAVQEVEMALRHNDIAGRVMGLLQQQAMVAQQQMQNQDILARLPGAKAVDLSHLRKHK